MGLCFGINYIAFNSDIPLKMTIIAVHFINIILYYIILFYIILYFSNNIQITIPIDLNSSQTNLILHKIGNTNFSNSIKIDQQLF